MSVRAFQATVVSLVAEVRVLMVGSRQITLSVFRQLDVVSFDECEAMGRVNDPDGPWVVGRHHQTGALIRARFEHERPAWTRDDESELQKLIERVNLGGRNSDPDPRREQQRIVELERDVTRLEELRQMRREMPAYIERYNREVASFQALPLIVMAGLK